MRLKKSVGTGEKILNENKNIDKIGIFFPSLLIILNDIKIMKKSHFSNMII